MRIAKWILAAAVAVTAMGGKEQPKVQLCMTTSVQNSSYIEWSKKIATEIFNEAGVSLEWAARKACRPDAIRIRIQDNTAPETHPHAYAYAMPYEGHTIVVLYDRVEKENKGAALPYVLAHVLAHEIGHILDRILLVVVGQDDGVALSAELPDRCGQLLCRWWLGFLNGGRRRTGMGLGGG